MSIVDVIRGEVGKAQRKLQSLIRRGVITLMADSYFMQVEVGEGDRYDDLELWQQFGITSLPIAGGEALLVKVEGRGEGAVVVATTDRAHRPTGLASGDSVLYAALDGDQAKVHCKADGDIDLTARSGKTVNVGGNTDFLLKGTSFNSAHATMLSKISAALAALSNESFIPSSKVPCTDAVTAIAAYTASASGLLATKGKVE